jgi:FAD/FMN-containing dehydrogenase
MVSGTTPTAVPVLDPEAVAALAAGLRGEVLRPGNDGYEASRQVWNGMIDKRPALIARCAGVADVIAAVEFARTNALLLAVRCGGHNIAGTGVCDGGLVLDLSPMKGIRVDPGGRTVRADGGVLWGELDGETQAFGLATTGGFISTTGIAGLTLGGGFGWLMRSHGLACDNLIAADVVTADGLLVVASAEENPDLFWGLRGGGGNFGVVTSFAYRLHEVGPEVLAGPLFHPLAAARDGLRFLRDATPTMPDALSCAAALLTSPEGVPLLGLVPAYIGPLAEGEAAVQPLRAFGSPVADLVAPLPYRALQQMFDAAFPAGRRSFWKSSFLRGLEDAAIDIMVEHFARVPSPYSTVFLEQFGGAVSRVGVDETAFSHRNVPFNVIVISGWDDPSQDAANIAWARELWTALQPFAAGGVYVNYLGDAQDEGASRIRDAYGAAKYDRLAALKAKYDPTNLFRVNQNIAPAG